VRAFFFFSDEESDGAISRDLLDIFSVDFTVEFEIEGILVLFGACRVLRGKNR
jgi:hypothetical protein